MRKADREKLRENREGFGERRESGACKHCFQYIFPVYQLLVYPVIGQFWQFTSTMSIWGLGRNGVVDTVSIAFNTSFQYTSSSYTL